jgi:hypothetical protein
MAQRVVVELFDDLDQSPATGSVAFSLDGVAYAIDLSDAHQAELRAVLQPYIDAGRKVTSAPQQRQSKVAPFDSAAVRAWAGSNGINLPKRGRIPNWVVKQYHAAGY